MRKHILLILILLPFASCNRFDDSAIWDELDNINDRIDRLEASCKQMNNEISALQSLVAALQENDFVTGISEIVEDGKVKGYTIYFSRSGAITIYHGKDGADGSDGEDGLDGTPGKDGHTPTIGVRQDGDGVYYWTLDGEWLLDDAGNKIPTTGKDGADGAPGTPGSDGRPGSDGQDGTDGKDGITPLLKIEDDYWFISYDEGATWTKLYKAVGEDGKDGEDGKPGQDGTSGDSFFSGIDTSDPDYIIITLSDGSEIKLPTWKVFEELQTAVNKLNTNVSALHSIVSALQEQDYVTGISPITENGYEVGYTICFSQSLPVTIYHGQDGSDGLPGTDGKPGVDGRPGQDGKDGCTPVIGVKQGTPDEDWTLDDSWIGESDGLQYYWTIDGEWLLDEDGHRIPATGRNGSEGACGGNGATPKLKIEDGQWYVSLDGGKTWQQEPLGPATSSGPDNTFSEITYDDQYLYITLPDGENIILSRQKEKMSISCSIEPTEITGRTARFTGTLGVPAENIRYSKIIVYYSEDKDFNIHDASSVSTTSFDYNNSFEMVIADLKPETKYYYCLSAEVKADKVYSIIREFETTENGIGENENPGGEDYEGTIDITQLFIPLFTPGAIYVEGGAHPVQTAYISNNDNTAYVNISPYSEYISTGRAVLQITLPYALNAAHSKYGVCLYSKKGKANILAAEGMEYIDGQIGAEIIEMPIPTNAQYIRTTWHTKENEEACGISFSAKILYE